MKNLNPLFFTFLVTVLVSACGNKDGKNPVADMSTAVCIWDKASLVEKPEKGGKWLSAINMGEKLSYLDETRENTDGNKKHTYYKVKLLDGKEGWVRSDFVALGANVAAVFNKADIYDRPDLSAITKKTFETRDILAIKTVQGDWAEVTGKRRDGKWIETGWIKYKGVTTNEKDIAVALYMNRALAKTTKQSQLDELLIIAENEDLQGSSFDYDLETLIERLQNDLSPQEEERSTTDTLATEVTEGH